MTQVLTYDPVSGMVVSVVDGEVTKEDILRNYGKALQFLKENSCLKILSDYRGASLKLSTTEILELSKILNEVAAKMGFDVRSLKRAVVFSKQMRDYRFYQDVSTQRKLTIRIFQEVEEAAKWLAE